MIKKKAIPSFLRYDLDGVRIMSDTCADADVTTAFNEFVESQEEQETIPLINAALEYLREGLSYVALTGISNINTISLAPYTKQDSESKYFDHEYEYSRGSGDDFSHGIVLLPLGGDNYGVFEYNS